MEVLVTMQFINTLLQTNKALISICYFPLSFIEVLTNMILFINLFNVNSNKKQRIIYIFSSSFLVTFSKIIIPIPYNLFFNLTIMFLFTKFFFKISSLKALFCITIPYTLTITLESILFVITYCFFGIHLHEIFFNLLYTIGIPILTYLIIYIFYLLLKKSNFHINILDMFMYSKPFILILTGLFVIIVLSYNLCIAFYYSSNFPIGIAIVNIFILIAYFIFSIYFLIVFNELESAKQNIYSLQLYNKTLSIMHDNIRAFKHDFNNIIQSIGGYIETNDINGLQKYYKDLLKDCYSVGNLEILNPNIINNPSIYSILASKYYKAKDKNITISFEVGLNLNSLNISIYELTRILGILLDNSIEASDECNEKCIHVKFLNDSSKHRQIVIIENTYANKNIDTIKIFEKSYTTKEHNTGLGLWEVNEILNKHKNLSLYTSKNDKYFSQQLEIYET